MCMKMCTFYHPDGILERSFEILLLTVTLSDWKKVNSDSEQLKKYNTVAGVCSKIYHNSYNYCDWGI